MATTGRACLQYLLHLAQDNLDFRLPVSLNLPTKIFLRLFTYFILSVCFGSNQKYHIHCLFCVKTVKKKVFLLLLGPAIVPARPLF